MAGKRHPVLWGLMIYGLVMLGLIGLWKAFDSWWGEDWGWPVGQKIAVVPIRGLITDSREVVEQIKKHRKDPLVKAIILRIESPGGGTAASQEIYREVVRTAARKKVVASMGNVAASGGYYVALGANRIVANPATLTGSIGVIMELSNIQGLLKKIGISREAVKSGPSKDIGSPVREITPEERKLLEGVIHNVHRQFVEAVVKSRGLDQEAVEKIADGRILTGQQAKELGLVDELGGFEDAVELAKKMVGLTGEVKVIYPEKRRFSFWDLLFEKVADGFSTALPPVHPSTPLLWVPPPFYSN